jgi:hypothetical protein
MSQKSSLLQSASSVSQALTLNTHVPKLKTDQLINFWRDHRQSSFGTKNAVAIEKIVIVPMTSPIQK